MRKKGKNYDRELRIRYMTADQWKQIEEMMLHTRKKKLPEFFFYILDRYKDMEKQLGQYATRNSQLHAEINKYHSKEREGLQQMDSFVKIIQNAHASMDKEFKRRISEAKATAAKFGKRVNKK